MAELIADREQGPAPAQPIFKARRGGGGGYGGDRTTAGGSDLSANPYQTSNRLNYCPVALSSHLKMRTTT